MAKSLREKAAEARQRLKEKSAGSGGSREEFWLEAEKPVQVRVLPSPDENELFVRELTVWSIPGHRGTFIDPASIDMGNSPMQELYDELKKENSEANKKLLGWFKPKTRWFMRLLVRDLDDKGKVIDPDVLEPRYFFSPMSIADELLKLYDDDEYGDDIIGLEEGLDFTFEKTGKGLDTEYSASARRKTSLVHEDQNKVNEMMAGLETLEDKLKSMVKTEDELEELLSTMTMDKPSEGSKGKASSMKRRNLSEESEDSDIGGDEDKTDRPSSQSLRDRMRNRSK